MVTASSASRTPFRERSSSEVPGVASAAPVISLGATSNAFASAETSERLSSARSPFSSRDR